MLASLFLDTCVTAGIDFFTGVPDSLLKSLCDELFDRYGTDGERHIVAHNEGGAVALCAGHFLAAGRPGLCYMQNSGLGNAVNPLTSLTDAHVYGIPCLLIIGWRGEPGTKDEPQHVTQGRITLQQLDLLDIPYRIVSVDTPEDCFHADFSFLRSVLQNRRPAALVVRKGALSSSVIAEYGNQYTMTRERAAGIILSFMKPDDLIVSTTGKLSREIFEIRENESQPHFRDFLTVGSMGHAAMIALGMSESLPGRHIWCLDGDGATMMHRGSLALIGRRAPSGLIHIVINNGAHETVGGMPVCSGALNLHSLAEAAGYSVVLSADSEESLIKALSSLAISAGPVFLEVKCACGARSDLGRPTVSPRDNLNAMMKYITKSSQF